MVDPPKKLIIVGEQRTGKTSLIKVFKDQEALGSNSNTKSQTITSLAESKSISQSDKKAGSKRSDVKRFNDFSLRILHINGKKVRCQLWDQGANMNAQTTFQPLYTRHVSGCVIVANTSNPRSLELAHRWKGFFDKKTKTPNEPSIPATLFINHDHKEGGVTSPMRGTELSIS